MKQQLTHRTNVLLSCVDYDFLSRLSVCKKKSIGFLVRKALHNTYMMPNENDKSKSLQKLQKLGSKVNKENLTINDIKKWVQEGRINK